MAPLILIRIPVVEKPRPGLGFSVITSIKQPKAIPVFFVTDGRAK